MALKARSTSSQNQMLVSGSHLQHHSATNFNDQFENPTAKRLKRSDSTNSSPSRRDDSGDEGQPARSPVRQLREIPDSEAESDEEDATLQEVRKTDLESALPPVKIDKEAIAQYEAARAAEAGELDLQGRLGQRKWVQGKSSIYVDAFNLALETVLEDEAHLFDEAEIAVFHHWRELSYEGQYLYVRLFLRKTAAWHRINRLGYYGDIANLPAAVQDLLETRKLPAVVTPAQTNPGEPEAPKDAVLGDTFTFADGSEDFIDSLEEASSLLKLDELKALAKEVKVHGKNKQELLKALRKTSQAQSGLGWATLKRSDSEKGVKSEDGSPIDNGGLEEKENSDITKVNRDSHLTSRILASTGSCIRLSSAAQKLFERVHLVFYRSTEWTEKSLTTIILARISRRNFPSYIVSRSSNIFPTRSDLIEFEASIRTQYRIDNILEFNGTVQKAGLETVKETFEQVYPRWCTIVVEEQRKEDRVYESGEGAYLRRFSPAWVYTRIVHKGTYALGRFKEHEREHRLLTELLAQRLFHAARRGAWYQRKALLEEHYMWALKPRDGRTDDAQKKHWKQVALRTCEDGLQDRSTHLIYHYDLQKRILKLEKSLKIPKRLQHDFMHVRLAKPLERTMLGIRLERPQPILPPSRRNSAGTNRTGPGGGGGSGGKTIWLDEHENGNTCSVEEMCLSHYRSLGWKGYHSEGGIVRTLFGLLFYDILFTYIPNVFQTPYQTCPLDLHTDAFFPARASEIQQRLVEIGNGGAERIVREVWEREGARGTCVVGVDWGFGVEDLVEVVRCFGGERLGVLCLLMAQEYQVRGGGVPDLFLWRVGAGDGEGDGEVMFAEVKSENDRLSDTQRLWIHVLAGAGVKVELCSAVAREVRVLR